MPSVQEGSVLGVSYDQSSGPPTVNFFVNGAVLPDLAISSIRGQVVPACGVSGEATVSCNFGHAFAKTPPPEYHFDGVMMTGKMM